MTGQTYPYPFRVTFPTAIPSNPTRGFAVNLPNGFVNSIKMSRVEANVATTTGTYVQDLTLILQPNSSGFTYGDAYTGTPPQIKNYPYGDRGILFQTSASRSTYSSGTTTTLTQNLQLYDVNNPALRGNTILLTQGIRLMNSELIQSASALVPNIVSISSGVTTIITFNGRPEIIYPNGLYTDLVQVGQTVQLSNIYASDGSLGYNVAARIIGVTSNSIAIDFDSSGLPTVDPEGLYSAKVTVLKYSGDPSIAITASQNLSVVSNPLGSSGTYLFFGTGVLAEFLGQTYLLYNITENGII